MRNVVCVNTLAYVFVFVVFLGTQAQAAVTHEFLAEPSAKLSRSIPAKGPKGEAVSLPGPLQLVSSMAVDAGELYVAEGVGQGSGEVSRVDRYDASSGAFLAQFPQVESLSFLHQGVAIGRKTGAPEVYVGGDESTEEGKQGRVAVFDGAGNFQHAWTGAVLEKTATGKKFGCFECSGTGDVAVDNSALSWAAGDVYVADPLNAVVDVFDPQEAKSPGEEPEKVAAKLEGTCAAVGEVCPGEAVPFGTPIAVAVSQVSGLVLVVDGEGNAEGRAVDMFKPAAIAGQYEFLGKLAPPQGEPLEGITQVAVDPSSSEIYLADKRQEAWHVDQFSAAGEYLGTLTRTGHGPFQRVQSVAVEPASHDVYVGEPGEPSSIDVFAPDIVIPDVATLAASAAVLSVVSGEGRIEATLNGTVNPREQPGSTCRFVWGTTKSFGHEAPCEPEAVPTGNTGVAVQTTLKGLAPGTTYFYRLQASDDNGTNPGTEGQDRELTTPGPTLGDESVSNLASTAATLSGAINPNGLPTAYFFQYGRSTSYEAQSPAAPSAIGAGSEQVPLEPQRVQGLAAGTIYHYRLVAVSELEVEGKLQEVRFPGTDYTFTTQGPGGFTLPDGRQWELVSPADRHGARLFPIGLGSLSPGLVQSSASGAALTYLASNPTEELPPGYWQDVQILSTRASGGWASKDISLPLATPPGASVGYGHEYRYFSSDLSRALVEPQGEEFTSLKPEAFPPDTERTPYVRHDSTCAATPATCFEPLLTGAPGYADVPEGTPFGKAGPNSRVGNGHFVGATPDQSRVILENSDVPLTATNATNQLYEWSAGKPPAERLQLVSTLPCSPLPCQGEPAASPTFGVRHSISDDGSRVLWEAEAADGHQHHVYLRDATKQQTLQLDIPEQECASKGECGDGKPVATFQGASSDGSRVFFTDTQRLTRDSGTVGSLPDLYVCEIVEVAGELSCKPHDVTPPSGGEPANVLGVLGSSEDGSWVYFVADGVLGDGAERGAVSGNCTGQGEQPATRTCDLYVWHGGETLLVGVLSAEEALDWVSANGDTARVAPGGRWLAFMSNRSLTGYDNLDADSTAKEPHRDEEVFLYHAATSASGKLEPGTLVCASCNPTGARPVGVAITSQALVVEGAGEWTDKWLAANIPAWTPFTLGGEEKPLYQSRYLSDEGRLFFNSHDALGPQDVNNNQDVYEYEPAGVGGCSSSSSTFSPRSDGCVSLISSGRAAGESAFLDASETGEDVFFLTGEQLVSQEVEVGLSAYDAHVCSAAVPCLSAQAPPPPCTTADSCRPASAPQPSIFGAPASASFSGAGNLAPPAPPPAASTHAHAMAKALRQCRKRYKKASRKRACERHAHRRYGAKPSRKAANRGTR